jgi:hypothetical protein
MCFAKVKSINSQLKYVVYRISSVYITLQSSIQTCIPDGHLHGVTYIRCIDKIDSPDDEYMGVGNM